jgi:hypothetical protein
MGVFDTSTPAGTEAKSLGDNRIREFKVAVQEALRGGTTEGTEAVFPGSAPTTAPVFRYRGLKGTTGARPSAGQYGLYFNETRNAIQRDNGTTWDDIGTLIPADTVMVFYQAAAPTGWTAVAINDRFLRVVTAGGTGGATGGSGLTPSSTLTLEHSHTVNAHTHDMGNHTHAVANHQHPLDYTLRGGLAINIGNRVFTSGDDQGSNLYYGGENGGTGRHVKAQTTSSGGHASGAPSTNTSGSAAPATDSQLTNTAFQYADVIIATKD